MKATDLIDLAASKGYGIGRIRRGVYRLTSVHGERQVVASYHEFVRIVKGLPCVG